MADRVARADAPTVTRPPLPAYSRWGIDGTLLGGIDSWDSGGGVAGELRLGAGWMSSQGAAALSGAYGGRLEHILGPDGGVYQDHLGELVAGVGLGAVGLSAVGGGRLAGSPDGPWWELRGGGRAQWAFTRRASGTVSAGVTGRGEGSGRWLAPTLGLAGELDVGRRLDWSAWLEGQLWGTSAELPTTLEGVQRFTWSYSARTRSWFALGGVQSWADDSVGGVAGVPVGGSTVGYLDGGVSVDVWRSLSLLGDVRLERGWRGLVYGRTVAMLGLSGRVGRAQVVGERTPRPVKLVLSAPGASEVAVVGEFTGWRPESMNRREDGRWELAVVLVPGNYEYAYIVDGQPVRPPEASQVRPDGFGGENGVLVVASSR